MRLLRFPDLVALGIFTNRMTLKRAIDERGFPPGRLLTPNARAWTEEEIDAWVATRPTARKASTRKVAPCAAAHEVAAAAQMKPPHDPRDAPIDSLRLSVRSHNALLNNGINTVGDLIQLAGKDLLRAPNFSRKSLVEIRAALADLGLYLKGETPSPLNRRSAFELEVAE